MKQQPLEQEINRKNGAYRTANTLEVMALWAVLLFALMLLYTSMTSTNYIDPKQYSGQHILAEPDSIVFNLAFTAAAIVAFRVLRIARLPRWFVVSASVVFLFALACIGIAWSLLMRATPISDQQVLFSSALNLAKGDYSTLQDTTGYEHFYFVRFPFQFGFLSILEGMVRIFGERGTLIAIPILNVLLLVSGYAALLLTTDRLFGDHRVTFLTLLLLCLCPQPIFACVWMYGLIPALALTLWSVYFAVRFMQSYKSWTAILAAVCSALAVYCKPNAWIGVAAIAIVFVIHAIKTRGWKPLVAAVLLAALCIPLPKLAQAAYEERIGTEFGKGYPMSSWMAMGMQESWMAAGWYNEYSKEMYNTYGTDLEAISERNKKDIAESRKEFAKDPEAAGAFYQEKFASQWNEPTMESLWIAVVTTPYGNAERSELAQSFYDGRWPGVMLEKEMNYMQQVVYAGFALGLIVMLRKRESGQMIFPITILGGILFHLLFEANSKYALTYLPMFLPIAAYGILAFGVNAGALFIKKEDKAGKDAV